MRVLACVARAAAKFRAAAAAGARCPRRSDALTPAQQLGEAMLIPLFLGLVRERSGYVLNSTFGSIPPWVGGSGWDRSYDVNGV